MVKGCDAMKRIKKADIIIIAVILVFSAVFAVNILFSNDHSDAVSNSDKATESTEGFKGIGDLGHLNEYG